jgi:hypothetical protein
MKITNWPLVLALVVAGPPTLVGGCETSDEKADDGSGGTSTTGGTGGTGTAGGTGGSGTTSSLDCNTTDDPTGQVTPVLDACHSGWKQTDCESCHEVPMPNHIPDPVPSCGGCHGGNGACLPFDPAHEHLLSEDCIVCHVQSHEFTVAEDCVRCHFAVQGVVECP